MKYYLTVFFSIFFILISHSQSTIEIKNKLIDSLLTAKIDTYFVIKDDCTGCGKSIRSPISSKKSSCGYSDTYFVFWVKNSIRYYKAFNNCYETPAIKTKEIEWLKYYFENKNEINSINALVKHKSITIKSDTIYYAMNCLNTDSIPELLNDYEYGYEFFKLEFKINDLKYESGDVNEYILCSYQTKDIPEIKILKIFNEKLQYTEMLIESSELSDFKNKRILNWCCD